VALRPYFADVLIQVRSMTSHSDVIRALGDGQWHALQASGLPLMVTNELLSVWLEGWPDRFNGLLRSDTLVPMLKGMGTSLRRASAYAGDPEMTHISLTEKLQMAGLPLEMPRQR
jgi:hypothetical protein